MLRVAEPCSFPVNYLGSEKFFTGKRSLIFSVYFLLLHEIDIAAF